MGVDKGRNADPPGDDWDDDGWDLYEDESADGYWLADDDTLWADAALDGRVRQQLATLVPLRHEAFDRWDEIQPRMARARRRRHAAQAMATSVLVAAVALVGMQGAGRLMPDESSVVQAANGGDMATSDSQPPMVGIGEATSTIAATDGRGTPGSGDAPPGTGDGGPEGQGAEPDDGSATDAPAGDETTLSPAGAPGSAAGSSAPVNGGSAASSVSITPPASYPATTASPATNSPTSRSTTSTTRSTTTTRATTTTTRATTTTTPITVLTVRDLATIDVTVRGTEIRLVAVHDNAGVTSQVHNSGPQKIEITFRKGAEEHDLVASVHNGNVVTSIVDAGDD